MKKLNQAALTDMLHGIQNELTNLENNIYSKDEILNKKMVMLWIKEIIRVYLVDTKMITRICNRCGSFVHKSDVKGYYFVCNSCDENLDISETEETTENTFTSMMTGYDN